MTRPARILAIFAVALLAANSLHSRYDGMVWWLAAGLLVTITVALLCHPLFGDVAIAVTLVAFAVCALTPELRNAAEVIFPVCYVTYLASAYSPTRWRRVWLVLLMGGVGLVIAATVFTVPVDGGLLGGMEPLPKTVIAGVSTVMSWIMLGFFWLLGMQTRNRHRDLALLQERAEMAGAVERTRIAREMHDIVAHTLSGIMAVSDGARFAAKKDPQVAVDTLVLVSEQSREALDQMRGLLSVLRTDTTREASAAPGVADLQTLIAETRRAGQDIDVEGLDLLPEMPELTQFTVYRVVQEMLSNMLRHADGPGRLVFVPESRGLRITATNLSSRPRGSGYGLVGMAERVRAHDGTLRVSEDAGRFAVVAEVPL